MKLTDSQQYEVYYLLSLLDSFNIQLLARTITNNLISIESTEDAVKAIILHEKDLCSLLNRKVITRGVLFKYLHNKNIEVPGQSKKQELINRILQEWQTSICVQESSQSVNVTEQNDILGIDALAEQFTEWFYSLLNEHNEETRRLIPQHFWDDCRIYMTVESSSQKKIEEAHDSHSILTLLNYTKTSNNLFFNPNTTREGVKGRMEAHGLVLVMACGTLHQTSNCVGLFEQLFGLVRDPFMENNWRIKFTKLRLKSEEVLTQPTLTVERLKFLENYSHICT